MLHRAIVIITIKPTTPAIDLLTNWSECFSDQHPNLHPSLTAVDGRSEAPRHGQLQLHVGCGPAYHRDMIVDVLEGFFGFLQDRHGDNIEFEWGSMKIFPIHSA